MSALVEYALSDAARMAGMVHNEGCASGGRRLARPEFDGPDGRYRVVELPYPADSGAKVAMARTLFSFLQSEAETMVLLDE